MDQAHLPAAHPLIIRARQAAIVLALCAAAMAGAPGLAAAGPSHEAWIGAWGFSPMPATPPDAASVTNAGIPPPEPDLHDVTVRQIVRLASDATRVRIRFSNEFGAKPLVIGDARVALYANDGAIVPGSDHALRFAGKIGITVSAGAPALSDTLEWTIPALTRLAVSIYLPDDVAPPAHRVSGYISDHGNHAALQSMPGAAIARTGAVATGVEVVSSAADRVVVTLGDSITEGFGSTVNEFRGWPDRLAERLNAKRATRGWSVVNAGINSNRLLHNYPGMGALARFDRDVLSVPGVRLVMLLEGINDIGYSHTVPSEAVSADDIIAAYRQLIARAHAHGIAIVAGTLTPFEAAHYFAPEGETARQAVNQWIRTSGAFDGVMDFDVALRDPAHPTQVNPSLTRGDHLHPNDKGYGAMADAIDPGLFRQAAAHLARSP